MGLHAPFRRAPARGQQKAGFLIQGAHNVKAYLIDTPNKRVSEVEWDGNYKSINKLIKASIYTVVQINEHGDSVFVDDEGLINGNPHGWFVHKNYPQPLRGYGLVLGLDEDTGESIAPRATIDELRAQITFPEDSELDDPEAYAHVEVFGTDDAHEFLDRIFGRKP